MPKRALSLLALSALLLAGCGSPSSSAEAAAETTAAVIEGEPRMPELKDLTFAQAKSTLTQLGIEDYTISSDGPGAADTDWVVESQYPAEGFVVNDSTDVSFRTVDPNETPAERTARHQAAAEAQKKAEEAAKKAEEKRKKEEAARKKAEAEAKKPKVFTGYGPDVIKWKKPEDWGSVVATFEHSGWSNFAVHTLDSGLDEMDLLVNTIGNYQGTVLFDDDFGWSDEDAKALDIAADGSWKVTLKNTDTLKDYDGSKTIKGSGDSVFRYSGDTEIFKIRNTGESNFSVIQHAYEDTDLIVNEIGNFNGTEVISGPAIIEVSSEGSWSFKSE